MSFKLHIDTWKGYYRNNGEVKFFANDEQFLDYIREVLGDDFADALVENFTADAEELYDNVCGAIEDTDLLEIDPINPIVMLKQYRKDYELLKKCRDFMTKELDI